MERHTLQGALSLLEKGQNDISQYDQQDLILYIWCGQIRNVVVKLFHPITENKLANDYPIFRSIPAVILMAGFIPVMVLVVFSYGMFKFITYEHKKMEFKYTKLPVKEIPKPQNNQLSYPPSSVFVFGFI